MSKFPMVNAGHGLSATWPGVAAFCIRVRKIALFLLISPLLAAANVLAAEPHIDEALIVAALKALPRETSSNKVVQVLQTGLWNTNRTAVAVSFVKPKASVIVVFLRQPNGAYLATDASGVEDGNFGKLGIGGRAGYERFETVPVQWLRRDDQLFQVVMRTRAWKNGKRYTVSEPLIIKPDGTVL